MMMKILNSKPYKITTRVLESAFAILLILYLAFVVVQRVTGNKSIMGYRLFVVATGSMEGVYDINDVIAVRNYDANKLKIGDDVAYRGNRQGFKGILVTHRIISIEEGSNGKRTFVTKGVQAPTADPSITEDQILGKVVGIVPIISQINHVVKTQVGFFLFVFSPLVLVIVLEVLQTITDIRVENHEIQRIERIHKEKQELI